MEGVTSTFKEGLILFYTLVLLLIQNCWHNDRYEPFPCKDFIPAFLYPVIKAFPNISGWKKMRSQCDEMSDFIREVELTIITTIVVVITVVGIVYHHHHQQHHHHYQVIDQHKEDFNPDNLRDFIDMFLLEVSLCVHAE